MGLDFSQSSSSYYTEIDYTLGDLAYNPPELLSSSYSIDSRDGYYATLENDGTISLKVAVTFPACSQKNNCPNSYITNFDYFNGYYQTNIKYDYAYTDIYESNLYSLLLFINWY